MTWQLSIALLCDFFSSIGLSWLIRSLAHKAGALDRPSEHKQHREPIPTMGGVAVFLSFVLGIALRGWPPSPTLMAVLLGSLPIVVVGFLDDVRGVNAVIKLGVLGLATGVLIHGGIQLHLGFGAPIDYLATFLWMGFISSAFNGIDNADGSAAGVAAICSFFTFAIAWASWQQDLALVAAGLMLSCLGFLLFNFPRPQATLFLGDTGSFFLGFSLGAMLIMGEWGTTIASSAATALALIAYPILDFLFILVVRGLDGRYQTLTDPITMCARDHSYHRLVAWGLRPREAILAIYAVSVLFGSVAVGMASARPLVVVGIFSGLAVLSLVLSWLLTRVTLSRDVYSHLKTKVDEEQLI